MKVLAYHITWGTYGTRLHGDPRGTVDRKNNKYKSPILRYDEHRWELEKSRLKYPPVRFTLDQMVLVQSTIPSICAWGCWKLRTCAAGPDHVHVILTSPHDPEIIRRLLKRWIGQELSQKHPQDPHPTWWAECGSIRWIGEDDYFQAATNYVTRQQASMSRAVPGPFLEEIDLSV